jgi:hypothetical protein
VLISWCNGANNLTFLCRYKGLKLESLVTRMHAFWTLRLENQMETRHQLET